MERVISIKKGRYLIGNDLGEERECFAKGSLKIKSDGILTGDYVKTENDVIVGVLPRKNRLQRPMVANVDTVAIVIADPPAPDFYLSDKLLASCFLSNVEAVLVVNKTDLSDENSKKITEQYSAVAKIFRLSALTGDGTKEFSDYLKGKTVVFTGQSAVGKTTLLNTLFGKNHKTGDVSEKTQRGRQTTTSATIVKAGDVEVIDTPGFTAFDLSVKYTDLAKGYADFIKYEKFCRFSDCSHIGESECGVKEAVEKGEINKSRYLRYVEIYKELKDGKKY